MATELVETDCRVFEVTMTPDTPGWCKREMTVRLISGPDLTDEEWAKLRVAIVRWHLDRGNLVRRVEMF